MEEEEKDGPWSRASVVLGCFIAPVLVLLLIVVVASNWRKFEVFVDSATHAYRDMQTVEEAIRQKYPSRDIGVELQRRSSVNGTIFRLELVDPRFLEGLDHAGRRQKALEIATAVRGVLPPERRYENYEVAFIREATFGLSVNEDQVFLFAAAELPP